MARTWAEWKCLAILEYNQEEVRRAAKGGLNTFGGTANTATANAATTNEQQPPPLDVDNGLHPEALAEMETALDNFANAVHMDNDTVAGLVNFNTVLTRTNRNFSDTLITMKNMLRNLYTKLKIMAKLANQPPPAQLNLPTNQGGGRRKPERSGGEGQSGGRCGRGDTRRPRGP